VAFGRLQVDVGVRDPGRRPERAQQAIAQIFGFVKKHLEKVLLLLSDIFKSINIKPIATITFFQIQNATVVSVITARS
jgi:hypothetical protein